jgi:hypothetical protein
MSARLPATSISVYILGVGTTISFSNAFDRRDDRRTWSRGARTLLGPMKFSRNQTAAPGSRSVWPQMRTVQSNYDTWQMAVLFAAVVLASLVLSGLVPRELYDSQAGDFWFESDLPRVYRVMTSRWTAGRTAYHPLFPMIVYPPTKLLQFVGCDAIGAIRATLAIASGAWVIALFQVLRAIGLSRLASVVFCLLGLSSASAMFFFAVPESFLFGSLTIMFGLVWAFKDPGGLRSPLVEACVSAATASISVSNWMVGVIATFYRRQFSQAVRVSAAALAILAASWTIEKLVFPKADLPFALNYRKELRGHVLAPETVGPRHVLSGFFAHSMVMPEIRLVDRPGSGRWPLLLTQPSAPFSSGPIGNTALVLWLTLVGIGALVLVFDRHHRVIRMMLGSVLVGQLALHLGFGNETFFYSLHWLPLLVTVSALPAVHGGRKRAAVIMLAAVCAVTTFAHNARQFLAVRDFITQHEGAIESHAQAESRKMRKSDPWPARPTIINGGSAWTEFDEAGYEPGGGLWPGLDTFQISFWLTDAHTGGVVKTSHDVAPSDVGSQHRISDGTIEIRTMTPDYRLTWTATEPRLWRLDASATPSAGAELYIMVRAVGWRFNRIRSIEIDDHGLRVNQRWRIEIDRTIGRRIGIEGPKGWPNPSADVKYVSDPAGWAFARIGPLNSGNHRLVVLDEQRGGSVDTAGGVIAYTSPRSGRIESPLNGQ